MNYPISFRGWSKEKVDKSIASAAQKLPNRYGLLIDPLRQTLSFRITEEITKETRIRVLHEFHLRKNHNHNHTINRCM